MDIFCDTNVLVAAVEALHPHHHRARPILESIIQGSNRGFAAAHSMPEMYAALTRMPVQPRIHPQDAKRLIEANVSSQIELIYPDMQDYLEALDTVAMKGMPGAMIYDALILVCAIKSGAGRIYTFNVTDFVALANPNLAPLICAP